MFRLETEIRAWCDAIRASGCKDDDSIEELRDHLCCEIERLQGEGITAERAFGLATGRLGSVSELAAELSREEGKMTATITAGDIADSTRQLAGMVKIGVPAVESIEIAADGTANPVMKNLLLEIRDDVSSGKSLAAAFAARPDRFDPLFCSLMEVAEKADALVWMLEQIASYKDKTEGLTAKIRSCRNYAIVVLFILFGLLLVVVSPLIGFLAVGALAALLFIYVAACTSSRSFREVHDRRMLRLPFLGELLRNAASARFSRVLSVTFRAGVPLVDALPAVAGAAGNVVLHDAIVKVREDVSTGMQLNFAMNETGVFPPLLIRMIASGEKKGLLDAMLDKSATYYESLVDDALDGIASLGQPTIIGLLIAIIVYQAISGG